MLEAGGWVDEAHGAGARLAGRVTGAASGRAGGGAEVGGGSPRVRLMAECLALLELSLSCLLVPTPPTGPEAPESSERWGLGALVPRPEREAASQSFARACNPSMGPTSWRRLTAASSDPGCGLAMYFSVGVAKELGSGEAGRVALLGPLLGVVAALVRALAEPRQSLEEGPRKTGSGGFSRERTGRRPPQTPGERVLAHLRVFYSRLLLQHRDGLAAAGQGHLVVRVVGQLGAACAGDGGGSSSEDPLWELPEREGLETVADFVEAVAVSSSTRAGRGPRAARALCAELTPLLGRCRAALRASVARAQAVPAGRRRDRGAVAEGVLRSTQGLFPVLDLVRAYARLARAGRVRPRRCLAGLLELCLLCNQCVFRQAVLAGRAEGCGPAAEEAAASVKEAADRTEDLARLVGLSQEPLPPPRKAAAAASGPGGARAQGGARKAPGGAAPPGEGERARGGAPRKPGRGGAPPPRRKKKRRTSSNAYVDAVLAFEAGGAHAGDLGDLEDFIVCKSGRDYKDLLSRGHSTL